MHDVRTYIYIYIYKKHIYIYDEDFSPLYDKCGARSARRLYWKNSMNNHVILKGVDVEEMKVIQLASEVHNKKVNGNASQAHKSAW